MNKLIILTAAVATMTVLGGSGTAEAAQRFVYRSGSYYSPVVHRRPVVYGPVVRGSDVRVRVRATPASPNRVRATVRTPDRRGPAVNIRTPNARIRVR